MTNGFGKTVLVHRNGQSMVEFALILPLFVLFIIGVFDLGRSFFAFIAITNAAREGVRAYTFSPNLTTTSDIIDAVEFEIGASTLVDIDKVGPIKIECGNSYLDVTSDDVALSACPAGQPIRVTVTYTQELILGLIFNQPLTLKRSAEMMVPWVN